MSDAGSPDPLPSSHSISHKSLDCIHLLASTWRGIRGVKNILIDSLKGLSPILKIFLLIKITIAVTVKDGNSDLLNKFDEEIIRNFI
jgi:hypothetical protein